MLDGWAKAWKATSAREARRNSLARYGYTRRRKQSGGRSGLYHGNGVWSKAASPVSLFETRPSEFEHLGGNRARLRAISSRLLRQPPRVLARLSPLPRRRQPRFESSPFWSRF